jgi:tetratricopeptide (TPR) repeat protein
MPSHHISANASQHAWLVELERLLRRRSISDGIKLLEEHESIWRNPDLTSRISPDFLLMLAQWVDVGFRDAVLLRQMLDLLTPDERLELKVGDYVRLLMAEAFYALAVDNTESCILTLENILRLNRELLTPELATLAHLWKARAHRKKADYVQALEHINAARELADGLDDAEALTAVIQIQQGWVLFQRGNALRALQVLQIAENVLKHTDHWIALGNIESARGRIIRRKGDYSGSLDHFNRAVALYEKRNPHHPNLARAVINLAFVKRLLALQLRKHIDHSVMSRKSGNDRKMTGMRLQPLHKQYRDLYQSAILELDRAKQICMLHNQHGGVASALLNAGYLHLDGGNLDLATREASEALAIADRTNNVVIKTRAHILSSWIENARFEGLFGKPEDAPDYARRAKLHCLDALALAESTQNKRLLVNAHIALGEVAANDFFHDYELARRSVDAASALLAAEDADYTLDELNTLKAKLMQKVGLDDTIRAWSQGMVSGKTLEEVTESFAEVVVTQLWLREDRKVARVARLLASSPKRIRRLIRSQQ